MLYKFYSNIKVGVIFKNIFILGQFINTNETDITSNTVQRFLPNFQFFRSFPIFQKPVQVLKNKNSKLPIGNKF